MGNHPAGAKRHNGGDVQPRSRRWARTGLSIPGVAGHRGARMLLAALATIPAWVGCGPTQIDVYDPATLPVPAAGTAYDDRDFATVLRENVKGGLVDYAHLRAYPEALDRYLGLLSVSGPASTPEVFTARSSRLCYYLNAYNAGVLKTVLFMGIPETVNDVRLPALNAAHRIKVDGSMQSLADLQEKVREYSGGDARVEFGMCDAAMGSPPLLDQPFRPDQLRRQLHQIASDAMNNGSQVRIDHEQRKLMVSTTIFRKREAFLEYYRRQTGSRADSVLAVLLQLADGQRRAWLNTAVGYELSVIPFDRALNRWTPATQPTG